jgi:hypothetical protein
VRIFKFGLHLWIMLTSVLSFLLGWIMLAHAPKPVQNVSSPSTFVTPLPTLAPLPNIGSGNDQNSGNFLQSSPFSLQPSNNNFNSNNNFAPAPRPLFRTGGS